MNQTAKDLAVEIAKLRRRTSEDGQTPHVIKMHPMTWRDFAEAHRDLLRFENAAMRPDQYMGLLVETDPAIPDGRALVFDADGDLLAMDGSGKYRKVLDRVHSSTETDGG